MKLAHKFTLGIGMYVMLTTVVLTLFARAAIERTALPAGLLQLATQARLLALRLDERIADARPRLLALRDSPLVQDVSAQLLDSSESGPARERLARHFYSALQANRSYLQLSYLTAADGGKELVRVDRLGTGGSTRRVADSELQARGSEQYMRVGLATEPGVVSVLPLGLDEEAGQPSVPGVLAQWFVTPAVDANGKLCAVLLLKLDATHLFDPFRHQPPGQRAYVVNAAGDYLYHADLAAAGVRSHRLQDDLPELAPALRVRGPWRGEVRDPRGHELGAASVPALQSGLIAVLTTPRAALLAAFQSLLSVTLWVGGFAVLLSWVLASYLSRLLTGPLSTLTREVEAFGRGEAQASQVSGSDEVNLLAGAFAHMSQQVRDQQRVLERQVEERRAAEQRALREAERLEFLGAVIQSTDDAIITKDLAGTITSWNPAAERLFGYKADEVVGQSIHVIVPQELRQELAEILQKIARGERVSHFDTERLTRDGRLIPVSLTVSPVRGPDGTIVGASKIATDVSERVRTERALHRQREQLERSNAALLEFAYVASHDLQEPLRMVASFTQLLGQRYKGQLDEQADKYIHFATDGALRMQRLIRDMLAYARAGADDGPLAPVSCEEILREVLVDLQPRIKEAGARVEVASMPQVLGDATQLRQLFQNLIGNALKFRGDRPPQVKVSAERRGDLWECSVQDNGIGIEEAHAERVFGMFQRLHARDAYEGSGIGLSIAKRVVERHGGRIWFRSVGGEGTTFVFTLQASEERLSRLQASA